MYKTSTFLTSLFCKFKVTDKKLRKVLIKLYTPIVGAILENVSVAQRVRLFKDLLPIIQFTIEYLNKNTLDTKQLDLLQQNISFSVALIKDIGIRTDSGSFSDIMKQVNLDDIACDIGECIAERKLANTDDARAEIDTRLKVLLADYNLVTQQSLSIEDICKVE